MKTSMPSSHVRKSGVVSGTYKGVCYTARILVRSWGVAHGVGNPILGLIDIHYESISVSGVTVTNAYS